MLTGEFGVRMRRVVDRSHLMNQTPPTPMVGRTGFNGFSADVRDENTHAPRSDSGYSR
jgi:hypothetical protein